MSGWTPVGDRFSRDLARIAAKYLRPVPLAERPARLAELQDCTSLYSPYTADLIDKFLKPKRRAKAGKVEK